VGITGARLLRQMSWFLFPATLFLGLLAADSIARERREGTLSLLLLTELTPREIVYGKMLSCGLRSFAALLACVPALMLAVLAGGVTAPQAALTGIGLLNTLFVSLAAGIWMSTVFGERRHAMAATLGLLAALTFGPQLLAASWLGSGAVPYARLLGLGGWMGATQFPLLPLRPGLFLLCWLLPTQALGWAFLSRAAVTLAATWQDRPHKQSPEPETADEWPMFTAAAAAAEKTLPAAATRAPVSWPPGSRPWDLDPIQWRVERLGSFEGLVWLAVGLAAGAQLGTLGSILSGGATLGWGMLSFVGIAGILFSGGLLAWAGARFFQDARRQQDIALLLTTPLGARNILAGQWRVLRRTLAWPLGLVFALALPAGLSLLYDFANGNPPQDLGLLDFVLIALNVALEALALCWVGMWLGLRARHSFTAVAGTVVLVQLTPLALAVALIRAGEWLSPWAASPHKIPPVMVAALVFILAKNLVLIPWARFRLRHELRLSQPVPRLGAPRAGGLTQPARLMSRHSG
jgi:hypothetical protein